MNELLNIGKMLKAAINGLIIGGVTGVLLSVASKSMKTIEEQDRCVQIKSIKEHQNIELFDSFCYINNLCITPDMKQAFSDLAHTMNRLFTLEKYIRDIPKHRIWLGTAIEYTYQIKRILIYIKMRNTSAATEKHLKVIREAAANACHNIKLETSSLFERR